MYILNYRNVLALVLYIYIFFSLQENPYMEPLSNYASCDNQQLEVGPYYIRPCLTDAKCLSVCFSFVHFHAIASILIKFGIMVEDLSRMVLNT